MALTVTEKAAAEVKKIVKEQGIDESKVFLKLGCKGGGCSGFQYNLDLVEEKDELDEEFESNGIKVLCDSKSYIYLNGTTLDFKDEIMGRGFIFENPNASHVCGCNKSFSV